MFTTGGADVHNGSNGTDGSLVSVIVPVYKVERYLRRCVESIIHQTYTNLEIILVDDGSPDNCGAICDEYAKCDSRIRVIHKENGGLSSARNAGLDAAKGEYITFVDSDDTVDLDMVEYLYNILRKENADISIGLHRIIKGPHRWISFSNVHDCVVTPKDCVRKLLYNDGVDTSAWAKLYRIDAFRNVRYPEGKLFEDIATTYKAFLNARYIAIGSQPKYNYMLRDDSIVSSSFNEKKMDLLEMTDNMGEDITQHFPDLYRAVLRRRIYARISTLNQLLQCQGYQKEKRELISFIKKYSIPVLKDMNVPVRDKVAIVLLNISCGLYEFIWNTFGKK